MLGSLLHWLHNKGREFWFLVGHVQLTQLRWKSPISKLLKWLGLLKQNWQIHWFLCWIRNHFWLNCLHYLDLQKSGSIITRSSNINCRRRTEAAHICDVLFARSCYRRYQRYEWVHLLLTKIITLVRIKLIEDTFRTFNSLINPSEFGINILLLRLSPICR